MVTTMILKEVRNKIRIQYIIQLIWNIYGDYNDVFSKQLQNGDKTLTGTINNDYNEVSVVQKRSKLTLQQ